MAPTSVGSGNCHALHSGPLPVNVPDHYLLTSRTHLGWSNTKLRRKESVLLGIFEALFTQTESHSSSQSDWHFDPS